MSTYTGIVPVGGKRAPQRIGQLLRWEGTLTHTASYATGGDTVTAKSLGMNVIEGGIVANDTLRSYLLLPQTDGTAKLFAITLTTGAQVANATNLSGSSSFATIIGH